MVLLSQSGHKDAQYKQKEGTLGNAKILLQNNEAVKALLQLELHPLWG